ncbi:MAG: polyprenyl synthetase family protein [Phycisphaerae bacterium]
MFPPALETQRAKIAAAVSAYVENLEEQDSPNCGVIRAVQYAMQSGGKYLRPLLLVECCRAVGGHFSAAVPAGIAIECVHVFSLVHDDLPAMDDDDLRRGQPTTHVRFGEADAVLAGDWLLAHAFAVLTGRVELDAKSQVRLVSCLANSVAEMIVGQSADIRGENTAPNAELLEYIHARKTASLISAACRMGAIAGGASPGIENALARFGSEIGHAFQIADDILDVDGDEVSLGKRTRKDADRQKQTFPAVHGVEASRAAAREKYENAVAALAPLGDNAGPLAELAEFMICRLR